MILNSITKKWLDAFINSPTTGLFIDTTADLESGLEIAHLIHSKLVHNHAPLVVLSPEVEKAISIESIRELQHTLSQAADRTNNKISRLVCIYQADRLTTEAQNALLKLLEELPKRTSILLVGSSSAMLNTLLSRCFMLPLLPISIEQAKEYAQHNGIGALEAEQFYMLSDGSWSVFSRLIIDGGTNNSTINQAKEYLTLSVFDKQIQNIILLKDKSALKNFLKTLALVCKSAMRHAHKPEQKQLWKYKLKSTLSTIDLIDNNANARLALLDLSIKL